jgi:hypothetical protein
VHKKAATQALIPPPPVVRAKLAENVREGRLLRSLLKVAILAAEGRHQTAREWPTPDQGGRGR